MTLPNYLGDGCEINRGEKSSQSKCTYFFSRHSGGPKNSSLSAALGTLGAGLVAKVVGGWVVGSGS